jgi:hypothetical protein
MEYRPRRFFVYSANQAAAVSSQEIAADIRIRKIHVLQSPTRLKPLGSTTPDCIVAPCHALFFSGKALYNPRLAR